MGIKGNRCKPDGHWSLCLLRQWLSYRRWAYIIFDCDIARLDSELILNYRERVISLDARGCPTSEAIILLDCSGVKALIF
jgi:hypothetical protein